MNIMKRMKHPAWGMLAIAIVTILFGIGWSINAVYMMLRYKVLGPMGLLFPAVGIIFIAIGIVHGYHALYQEKK